jgi:S-formylglutathione hydrolase FrmB
MKMKNLIASIVLLVFLYWGWSKLTSPYGDQKVDYIPASKKCFSEPSYRYCVYQAKQGTNGDIAYYLPGKDLDENAWNDETYYTAMLQKYWADQSVRPPTVVSVSFGPVWLLVAKNTAQYSGLLETFREQVIPTAEKKLGKFRHRFLFGESMGGLNSLIMALKNDGLFTKVASLCPVVYNEKPSASLHDLKTLSQRTGADPKTIFGIMKLAKRFASNDSEWDAMSPVELAKSFPTGSKTKFYLSCGLYDKYGNYEGAEMVKNTLQQRGVDVMWHPLYGNHCAIDVPSLGDFLTD